MIPVCVVFANMHDRVRPFITESGNRLQSYLLHTLSILCALQLPLSDIETGGTATGEGNLLGKIANQCATCSVTVLFLPVAWVVCAIYAERHALSKAAASLCARVRRWSSQPRASSEAA